MYRNHTNGFSWCFKEFFLQENSAIESEDIVCQYAL